MLFKRIFERMYVVSVYTATVCNFYHKRQVPLMVEIAEIKGHNILDDSNHMGD